MACLDWCSVFYKVQHRLSYLHRMCVKRYHVARFAWTEMCMCRKVAADWMKRSCIFLNASAQRIQKRSCFPLACWKEFRHTSCVSHNFTISQFILFWNPQSSPLPPRVWVKPLGRKIKSKDSVPIIAMMYSLASGARFYCCARVTQVLRGLPGRWLQSRRNVGSACCHTPWQGCAHTKAPVESLSPASFLASLR